MVVVFSLVFYYWGVASGLHTQLADEAVQAVAIEAGD